MFNIQITAAMLYDLVQCEHRPAMDLFGDPKKRDRISPFVRLLWEKGTAYENEDVDAYISVFWEEGFRYYSDMGTPDDLSDFVEFDDKYFEVTTLTEPQLIAGLPEFKMGYNLSCTIAREQVFQPNKSNTWTNDNPGIGV